MGYYINPAAFSAVFTVPAEVADRHLKLAKGGHIKALLYIMRNMSSGIDAAVLADKCGITEYEANEALLYWADAGILIPDNPQPAAEKIKPAAVKKQEKPARGDVARRGAEDGKIKYLLQETQMRFGRNLKSNETSTLVWLYDDQGMDVSLILMIVQYAAAHNKANMRFIESTAVDWLDRGIDTVSAADEELRKIAMGEEAWRIVSAVFGLERRKPSKKETELSLKWINEWKISKEMLEAAYDACVDAKSKFSFAYVAKIIESWNEKGYKKPEDIEKRTCTAGAGEETGYAAYDLELFEEMLNKKD